MTYSNPQDSYGAEPILLDFYLTNAPLHLVAQEKPNDDIADWRIRCTINGNSFVLDRWQPLYLKGFKPGKNWVQLEFLDEQGNPVKNVFNNTVRLISYQPKGKDSLSKLMRGELSAAEARGIVDPNYTAVKILDATPTPSPSPSPAAPTPTPTPAPLTPPAETSPELEPAPSAQPQPKDSKQHGFFNQSRRPAATPLPNLPPTLPEIIDAAPDEPVVPKATPQPESSPLSPTPSLEQTDF